MKLLNFPLTKITIGFILGIFISRIIDFQPIVVFPILLVLFFALLFLHSKSIKTSSNLIFGIITLTFSILIGISTSIIHKDNLFENHYTNQYQEFDKQFKIKLIITEKLKKTQKNYRFISEVVTINNTKSSGKVILNISNKDSIQNLKTGSIIELDGVIFKNKAPFNPNQFDYGKYLENQEIYAQVYSKKQHLKIIGYEPSIWSIFSNYRENIIQNLKKSNISTNELNVLLALIIGQQQDISPEILKDYQYAGAVHILSVSGLHVGYILLFITFLLKPIANDKKGSRIKLLIIILSLWAFAILAGMSPSIVRSVTMFSFLAIGMHLRRTVNMYHTLLVSILLILLFKPSFLFDVGFQLSYLALFFILWLQPLFASIWEPKSKILKYFWDIITVSFAAQIGAMPLSIFYFHQFPGLFFITNLLVLPLLGIIMAVGVLAIVIAVFAKVPFFIAKPLELLIFFLNAIIHWVASIESFVIKHISFSKEMLVLSYLVIILFTLWLKNPKFRTLTLACLSVLLLQSYMIFEKDSAGSKEEFLVLNGKKTTIIADRIGEKVTLYSCDSILENIDDNVTIQSYIIGNFCKIEAKKNIPDLVFTKGKKVVVLDSLGIVSKNIYPDIVIITQSPKLNMERLLSTWKPKQIVADNSNFKSYVKLWELTCRKKKIPFHSCYEKGFYKY